MVVAYRELGDNTKLIGRVGPSLVGFEACIISETFRRGRVLFLKGRHRALGGKLN